MKNYIKAMIQLSSIPLIILILGGVITQADDRPRLRIIHAAPGVTNVDVYVNDNLFFDDIFYKYISHYAPVDAGTHSVKVRPADTNLGFAPLFEVDPNFNYENTKNYTLIAAGKAENSLQDVKHKLLVDDNTLPGAGTSRVRIIHASLNTPTTELCLADVCHVLAFFDQGSGYFLMDPGAYQPKVRLNGTDVAHIKIPPLVLQDNSVHTIFLIGQLDGQPGLQLLYTLDAGDTSNPDQPPVSAPDSPGTYPPPAYPPTTGVLLSPKLLGVLAGVVLVIAGGIGFWVIRK